jgi:hypothetical protein
MYRKFSQLSFIIGLFFFIVSLILAANAVVMHAGTGLNLFTAITFFIFGLVMMLIKNKELPDQQ